MSSRTLILVLAAVLLAAGTTGATAYTGSLSSANSDITGSGFWITPWPEDTDWTPVTITWNVTQVGPLWNYDYVLDVYRADVSHMIIETSLSFGLESISDVYVNGQPFSDYFVELHTVSPGNPSIPGDVYGIKFDSVTGTTLHVNFNSNRRPVWGDFYAKCGASGPRGVQNTAWNVGFADVDAGPNFLDWDPTDPASDGSIQQHILVPDTVVPEPSGILALSGGLLGLVGYLRRRKS